MHRTTAALGLALALLAMGPASGPGARAASAPARDYARYAAEAYAAMQHYLAADHDLYREAYPPPAGANPYAYHWPHSRATAATLDLAGLPGGDYRAAVQQRLAGTARYWDEQPTFGGPGYDSYVRPPFGPGGDKFYDDNAWTGLELMRAHRLIGDPGALAQARRVFHFVTTGWDAASPCATGGVYWKQQAPWETNRDRNTVSTAPNAELALRLYQTTGERPYLDWALHMYRWTQANLRDPADGLYWDHLAVDAEGRCAIERTKWSYNQGTMVGAGALLYRVTGDAAYLREAERLARAALAHYSRVPNGYFSQDPAFNAIYFRNLLLLHAVGGDGAYLEAVLGALRGYADAAWDSPHVHQPGTGLFPFGREATTLLDQAAMVQIYAYLAWDPGRYDLLV